MGGQTLGPGIYTSTGAAGITGKLTLNGGGCDDGVWEFKTIGGSFELAASSELILANGAQAANVIWTIDGAITIGADSTIFGDMTASAAITVGAAAVCGSLISTSGAIDLGAGAESGTLTATGAITLGADSTSSCPKTSAAIIVGADATIVPCVCPCWTATDIDTDGLSCGSSGHHDSNIFVLHAVTLRYAPNKVFMGGIYEFNPFCFNDLTKVMTYEESKYCADQIVDKCAEVGQPFADSVIETIWSN